MYKEAPEGDNNKFEAACALRNLKNIMGQVTSNQSQGQQQHHRQGTKNGKVYHRYSSPPIAMRPFANEDDDMMMPSNKGGVVSSVIRDSKRIVVRAASQKRQLENTEGDIATTTTVGTRKVSNSSVRPVTVSDMNNWNRNLDNSATVTTTTTATVKSKQEVDNPLIIMSTKSGGGECVDKGKVSCSKSRDVFAVEGYHKTDHCYFKRPDGGYLKLPPDSFHKMAEGCYIKRSDGTFVRIDSAATIGNSQTSNKSALPNDSTGSSRPKSNVLRFLKRSKSHTPSTMKELQREKERGEKVQNRLALAERNAAAAQQLAASGQPAPNRRVMVTMIDGGLPVLATSKADRVQKPKAHLQVKSGKGKDMRNNKVNSGGWDNKWDTLGNLGCLD